MEDAHGALVWTLLWESGKQSLRLGSGCLPATGRRSQRGRRSFQARGEVVDNKLPRSCQIRRVIALPLAIYVGGSAIIPGSQEQTEVDPRSSPCKRTAGNSRRVAVSHPLSKGLLAGSTGHRSLIHIKHLNAFSWGNSWKMQYFGKKKCNNRQLLVQA